MKAIYKREVQSYFNSMIGWMFTAALTAFIGIYFMAYNLFQGDAYFSTALGATLFVLMVLVPILTMRSMAEERRSRTDQLLLTAPASVTAVVMGKYLAMLTVLACPLAIACLCPLIIRFNGTAFLLSDYASILAFFLLGAAEIAVGLLILRSDGEPGALRGGYLWTAAGALSLGRTGGIPALHRQRVPDGTAGDPGAGVLPGQRPLQQLEGHRRRVCGGELPPSSAAISRASDRFAGLLPDMLGRFSLLGAFDSFSVDHVFDVRGIFTVSLSSSRCWCF